MNKIVLHQYGGKASMAKWIVSHFPEHRVYLEPFCGSAAVLLAKPPSFIEIVNDLNERIINVFRQIQQHPQELAALLWATPFANANWRRAACNDLEEAAQFIAQKQQFFSGNCKSSTWTVDACPAPHKPVPKVWADWFLRILPAAARLKDVTLLCEDAIKAIKRVAHKPEALIYVDPPYVGHENEYDYAVDYDELVWVCNEAKAKVIVSEYPAAAPQWTGWRKIERVLPARNSGTRRSTSGRIKTELLFCNW